MKDITITKTQEIILAYLLTNPEEDITIRAMARKLNKSYPLIYNNLTKLENIEVITKKNVPPAHIIKLNKSAQKEILIKIEFIIKEKFLKNNIWAQVMMQDIISNTNLRYFTILIFGSYAKGKETQKSDLDLIIIVPKKEDIPELETAIRKSYTKVKKNYTLLTLENFREMIKNANEFNIGNEAIKHHILLYGIEQFYSII